MPVIRAAVCPHPPLLVPEVASGAAHELDALRASCLAAVDGLAEADRLVVVGVGQETGRRYEGTAGGSLRPYGANVRVGRGEPVLPLSLTIGAWLVEQSKIAGLPREFITVSAGERPDRCLALGSEIAENDELVGLLVLGDGAPRRSEHSPVHLHPRAEIFDTTVATAFAATDLETLAALDPDLGAELQAAGRAPWQVLAGALERTTLRGDLLFHAAPYGVGYFVAAFS